MTFFCGLHLILSSYFDVVDTRIRPSNVVNTRFSASSSNFPRDTFLIKATVERSNFYKQEKVRRLGSQNMNHCVYCSSEKYQLCV